jgi:hypothetical protein
MKQIYPALLFSILSILSFGQEKDQKVIRDIFDNVLESKIAYENLRWLCDSAPGRLVGTKNSYKAVDFMKTYFESIGVDTVFLQEFTTPAWIHINTEVVFGSGCDETQLDADALGPSPATPKEGISGLVIEVQSLEELKQMNPDFVKDNIVFFNRAFDQKKISPFSGYGATVDQRGSGPALAAKMGAIGVLVRSVGSAQDDFPHTGSTWFDGQKIPAVALSSNSADVLSAELKENLALDIQIFVDAEYKQEITTYNLIADIKGQEFPDEYIVVGGHIDAWFNSPGAHDDGIGCVQSADVLRIFKELKLNTRRSIRAIMYMDEELFQSGGKAYAQYSKDNNIKNYLALEADAGGFSPLGFNVDAAEELVDKIATFQDILKPYGIYYIEKGGSGVDIAPLKELGVPLMGYRTNPQRYMDLHHSANDTFDKVHIRELQLGSGNMAAIIFLIDQYLDQ